MNCQEFLKQVDEYAGLFQSQSASHDKLLDHAANCHHCGVRLESERALTAGLQVLAIDEGKIEAPSFLRTNLLDAFESHNRTGVGNVVPFPSRTNWTKWALAAAAAILIGFLLFASQWARKPEVNETAGVNKAGPGEAGSKIIDNPKAPDKIDAPIAAIPDNEIESSSKARRASRKPKSTRTEKTATQVASAEVKSEFVPLTYLNDATAMDSGIVVRVEIAREQLATLGLPYDLERANDIIKADIIVGDDGVARAIRLVQ